jgi:hypothetical protein
LDIVRCFGRSRSRGYLVFTCRYRTSFTYVSELLLIAILIFHHNLITVSTLPIGDDASGIPGVETASNFRGQKRTTSRSMDITSEICHLKTSGKAKRQKETTRNDGRRRGIATVASQQDDIRYDLQRVLCYHPKNDCDLFWRSNQEDLAMIIGNPPEPKRQKKLKPWQTVDDVRILTESAAEVLLLRQMIYLRN